MKAVKFHMPEVAYATFGWAKAIPGRDYVNVYGKLFGCYDEQLLVYDQLYMQVQLEGAPGERGVEYAKMLSPFDMRTLKTVKAGCCPPGLVKELLDSGPG